MNRLTIKQTSELFNTTRQAVHSLIIRKRLYSIVDDNTIYIPVESITAYIHLRLKELNDETKKLKVWLKSVQ